MKGNTQQAMSRVWQEWKIQNSEAIYSHCPSPFWLKWFRIRCKLQQSMRAKRRQDGATKRIRKNNCHVLALKDVHSQAWSWWIGLINCREWYIFLLQNNMAQKKGIWFRFYPHIPFTCLWKTDTLHTLVHWVVSTLSESNHRRLEQWTYARRCVLRPNQLPTSRTSVFLCFDSKCAQNLKLKTDAEWRM